jgi:mutator family transposase
VRAWRLSWSPSFLDRPVEGEWLYLWLDATYVKVRRDGRIVSVGVIVAVGVNGDGRREVLGMAIGPSEAEIFWTDFLRKSARRGLRGVKLVVSDAHEGLKAAVGRVFNACWQRCRVHFMRNVLAHAGKQGRRVVSAFIGTACASANFTTFINRRIGERDKNPEESNCQHNFIPFRRCRKFLHLIPARRIGERGKIPRNQTVNISLSPFGGVGIFYT